MKSKLKPLIEVAKVSIALGLLYYLFSSGRIDVQSLKTLLEPGIIVVGLACTGAILLLSSERWRLLLQQQKFNVPLIHTFRLTLIGNFFSIFVPGGVGGDLVKAVLIAQNHPQERAKVVLTVLADRILGLFTMTFIALCSFSFEPELLQTENSIRFVFLGLLILFLGFIVTFYMLLSRRAEKLREKVHKLTDRFHRLQKLWVVSQSYHLSTGEIVRLFGLSLISQLTSVVLFMIIASRLLPELPSLSIFMFAVPVGFMVTAIPLAPGGIGVGQAAFFYLFSKAMGEETDIGAIGITAFQALQLFYGVIGAVLFMLLKQKSPQLNLEKEAGTTAS